MNYDELCQQAKTVLEGALTAIGPAKVRLLAAVSGGPDSVLLLHVLDTLVAQWPKHERPELRVAHFNHMLRGREADEDEAFVRQLCEHMGLDLVVGRPKQLPQAIEATSETWAREERHRFFCAQTGEEDVVTLICLGHHADDRFETMLINLGRGSGLGGLVAMPAFDRSGLVVRPLLTANREDVMTALEEISAAYRTDPSNEVMTTWRNRLRAGIIPEMKDLFGDKLLARIRQTSEILEDENRYLNEVTTALAKRVLTPIHGDDGSLLYHLLDVEQLAEADIALRRRVLRYYVSTIKGGETDLSFQLIERLDAYLQEDWACATRDAEAKKAQSQDLSFGLTLVRSPEQWRLYQPSCLLAYTGSIVANERRLYLYNKQAVSLHSFMEMKPGVLSIEPNSNPDDAAESNRQDRLLLSEDAIGQVVCRNRLVGDKILFRSEKLSFHKSVKQYMQEAGIWPELRDRLMLLAIDEQVCWIPGLIRVKVLKDELQNQPNQLQWTELRFV